MPLTHGRADGQVGAAVALGGSQVCLPLPWTAPWGPRFSCFLPEEGQAGTLGVFLARSLDITVVPSWEKV